MTHLLGLKCLFNGCRFLHGLFDRTISFSLPPNSISPSCLFIDRSTLIPPSRADIVLLLERGKTTLEGNWGKRRSGQERRWEKVKYPAIRGETRGQVGKRAGRNSASGAADSTLFKVFAFVQISCLD